jgi:hypothetical protein
VASVGGLSAETATERRFSFPTAWPRLMSNFEQSSAGRLCYFDVTGGLRCPDLIQRHQALLGLVALCVYRSNNNAATGHPRSRTSRSMKSTETKGRLFGRVSVAAILLNLAAIRR